MGFEDNAETEAIFERYIELAKKDSLVDISQSHLPMDELALEIYAEMVVKKECCEELAGGAAEGDVAGRYV